MLQGDNIKKKIYEFLDQESPALHHILCMRYTDDISPLELPELAPLKKAYGYGLYYHQFSDNGIEAPYAPVLDAIAYYYHNYFETGMSPEEFFDACGVYQLHKEMYCSYLRTGKAERKEMIILSEVPFERRKVIQSLISCLEYIATRHRVLIMIDQFQCAPLSTLQLIEELCKVPPQCRCDFFFVFHEMDQPIPYRQDLINQVLTWADEECVIFDYDFSADYSGDSHYTPQKNFSPIVSGVRQYLTQLQNYKEFLTLEDMDYFVTEIHSHLLDTTLRLREEDAFDFYLLAAQCYVLLNDNTRATLMAERMLLFYDKHKDLRRDFYYNMICHQIHIASNQKEVSMKYAEICIQDAKALGDDKLVFLAEVLYYGSEFGGWRNIFHVSFEDEICNHSLADRLRQYDYKNTLSYYMVYGYNNDDASIERIARGDYTDSYKEAFSLIQSTGNTELLISAYTKYIVLMNSKGYHNAVANFYESKREILEIEHNERRIANLYLGKGYNYIINEFYIEAQESFVKAIGILYRLKNSEAIAEAFYNMTLNCFVTGDYSTAKNYINLIFRMIGNLQLKTIQLCSPVKLYALQALAYYRCGNNYHCYINAQKIRALVGIRSGQNTDTKYLSRNPHEDFFLHCLISGILDKQSGHYKEAEEEFIAALKIFKEIPNNLFYATTLFYSEYRDLLLSNGKPDKIQELQTYFIDFCHKNGFQKMNQAILAISNGETVYSEDLSKAFSQEELDAFLFLSEKSGKERLLQKQKKDIWFLSSWQEMMNRENIDSSALVKEAMNNLQDNFNLDNMLFAEYSQGRMQTMFCNFSLKPSVYDSFVDFFNQYHVPFFTFCTDKNYHFYRIFTEALSKSDTFALIGIPIYQEDKLVSLFIGTIANHNFDAKLMTSDDLSIMKTAMIQIHNALDRIKSREAIININSRLNELAITDQLTGLYNRQGLVNILEQNANRHCLLTVLYIDLDNFKYYNDTFGHDAGDLILKEFSEMIQEAVGSHGTCIRYGGDEFLILLYEGSNEIAEKLAKNIYARIHNDLNPVVLDYIGSMVDIPQEKILTCSIGITTAPECRPREFYKALKHADSALYEMKRTTKGAYCIWDGASSISQSDQ